MNSLKIFNHRDFGRIEITVVDGKELFGATQSAMALGYSNPHDAISRHCKEEGIAFHEVLTAGGSQNMKFISEGNLYRLISRSKLPNAERFESYVFDEILPTIRKTGFYNVNQFNVPKTLPEALRLAADLSEENERVKQQNEQLSLESAEQKQKLKDQEPALAIYNLSMAAQNTQSMADVAKALGTGRTRLFNFLREQKVIPEGKTVPYQRFIDSGYFVVRERPRASGDTVINDPVPRVTAKGFDYIARLLQKKTGA